MLWNLFKTALGVIFLTCSKIYGRRGSGLFRELQDQFVLQIVIMRWRPHLLTQFYKQLTDL